MPSEPSWKHYLTDYNENSSFVYKRFMRNDFLLHLEVLRRRVPLPGPAATHRPGNPTKIV